MPGVKRAIKSAAKAAKQSMPNSSPSPIASCPRRGSDEDDLRKPKLTGDGSVIPFRGKAEDAVTIINKDNAGKTVNEDGLEVKYDKNGFPEFPSKFDTVIDDSLLKNGDRGSHFKAANEALAKELKDDPGLAKEMGLTKQQADHILKEPPSSKSPPGLTWHHHQDVGKMQLVDRKVHEKFKHTGGFSIWGK